MTKEQLDQLPRRTASEVITAVPGGRRYEERVEVAVEAWANEEWWRGFYAGRHGMVARATATEEH